MGCRPFVNPFLLIVKENKWVSIGNCVYVQVMCLVGSAKMQKTGPGNRFAETQPTARVKPNPEIRIVAKCSDWCHTVAKTFLKRTSLRHRLVSDFRLPHAQRVLSSHASVLSPTNAFSW